MYEIEIPQKLYLILKISPFTKGLYCNTNDLKELAGRYESSEVRLRQDKVDYKYDQDTREGGLRGNFSNLLTFLGFFKKGNSIRSYYGIGYKNQIMSAIHRGDVLLNGKNKKYYAYTKNNNIKQAIEREANLYLIREQQSHISAYLNKHKELDIKRDTRFPKESIVVTKNNVCFLRAKINNYKDKNTIEYRLEPYWIGKKLKKDNIHLMVVVPNASDGWGDQYAVSFEMLVKNRPLFLYFSTKTKQLYDERENDYPAISMEEAKSTFSSKDANVELRLNYDWEALKQEFWSMGQHEQENKEFQKDEYSVFVDMFLHWNKEFKIGDKTVVDIAVSSSGGPDVRLTFAGGTQQKLELEHSWKNYIDHKHHQSNAWENCWLWAEEEWDESKIIKLFTPHLEDNKSRIPTHFLSIDNQNKKRKLFIVDWDTKNITEVLLNFDVA